MSFIRLSHLTLGECDPDTGQCVWTDDAGKNWRWTGGEQPRNGDSATGDPFDWFKQGNNSLYVGAAVLGLAILLRMTGGRRR